MPYPRANDCIKIVPSLAEIRYTLHSIVKRPRRFRTAIYGNRCSADASQRPTSAPGFPACSGHGITCINHNHGLHFQLGGGGDARLIQANCCCILSKSQAKAKANAPYSSVRERRRGRGRERNDLERVLNLLQDL